MKYDVVIVASGKGIRSGLGYNKAFFKLKDNKTVLEHSSSLFIYDNDCENIIVVTNKENKKLVFSNQKVIITTGGKERKDSVLNGLKLVKNDYVLIHDAARPYLNENALNALKNKIEKTGAAILGKKAIDTVKIIDENKIIKTINRDTVLMAETPQGFKTSLIRECYENSKDVNYTDEASLVEANGYDVYYVLDEYDNKKLTVKDDFSNI